MLFDVLLYELELSVFFASLFVANRVVHHVLGAHRRQVGWLQRAVEDLAKERLVLGVH